LAKRFGVSRFTVTRAIEILVDEGLVNRRQGLGSFLAAPPLKRTPSYLLSFTEAVRSQGRVASHITLPHGVVDRLNYLREPGQSFSDVILPMAKEDPV
jgi:GntR family transcriptional regulator